ncbi:MAG TPA: penicillin-binding transpeptidase domain-containing protein [Terriglobales bacterium]|nr:penicillin-binding transpeptidase domain-containing protein [Terriglobales bacterium]
MWSLVSRAFLISVLLGRVSAQTGLEDSVNKAFGNLSGAVVVVKVKDGRILAAHNLASLRTRIATPGSAIKPFTLELLLDKGLIRPTERIACRRNLIVGEKSLRCSHPAELTTFDAEEALAFSCNSYFVNAAARLHAGDLERRFAELGFTRASGLQTGEGEGRITTASNLAARQLLAVGAAGIEITPMEMAAGYLRLARLDLASASPAQKIVFEGLRAAADYGLARGVRADKISVAGKTGTASAVNDPHTHAWFAGFAPAEKPEIVVVVFLERGRGSVEAAGLARQIFEAYAESR